ncbi:hypothetical protein N7G274_005437 [Stereocaulon virgatum]|uniref:RNase III domain-containing protein n=1 Tax=Stereocaulon virgatum TaxID=373712 RepID=A0ABR4A7K2_9LECA
MGKKRHHESDGQSPVSPRKQPKADFEKIQHGGQHSDLREVSSDSLSNSIRGFQCPKHSQGAPNNIQALNYSLYSQPTPQPLVHRAYNGHPLTLPPLPSVKDESLESVIFTHHASLGGHPSTKLATSYDRLEFLGDAYIEVIASRLLFPRFPKLSAGRLSQQREMLVRNETLADYALAYGFDERAKLPSSMKRGGTDGTKIWTKTMGDVFEAYTAAIIIADPENGFQTAEAWLTALWEHKLSTQPITDTQTADPNAKTQLATKVMGKGIKLKYLEENPAEELRKEGKLIFHIGAYLTGWGWENVKLGSGKGLNKQEAGARAAADALTNPLTAQVASVKREYDANRWLERNIQPTEDEKDAKGETEGGGG